MPPIVTAAADWPVPVACAVLIWDWTTILRGAFGNEDQVTDQVRLAQVEGGWGMGWAVI